MNQGLETQEQSHRMILFCWIFGDAQAFPVEIGPEKTVGELKEAIVAKKPNRFHGVDADVLSLWKKIISSQDKNGLQLSDLKDEVQLDETWSIDDYFKEPPPKRSIHIVIRVPDVESRLHDLSFPWLISCSLPLITIISLC